MLGTIAYRLFLHFRPHLLAIAFVLALTGYFQIEPILQFLSSALLWCLLEFIDKGREIRREVLAEQRIAPTVPSRATVPPLVRESRPRRPPVNWRGILSTMGAAVFVCGAVVFALAILAYAYFYFSFGAD